MTPISEILEPAHVNISLAASDKDSAVLSVLARLNGDEQVKDFELLQRKVMERNASCIAENGCGICIAHGRTEAVSSLIMAAGRLSEEGIACSETDGPLRLVFVAGIPAAFNSEYLRIVGAIARICRDRHQLERLLAAKTAAHFVELLVVGEVKL